MDKLLRYIRGTIFVVWFMACVLPYILIQSIFFFLSFLSESLHQKFIEFLSHIFGFFIFGTLQLFAPYSMILSGEKSKFPNIKLSDGTIKWLEYASTEDSILISNHQIYSDWLHIWALGYAQDYDYYLKFVAKDEIRKIPIFGR
ncbi:hypothetical protein BB559_003786 [Furculomyces boomerangus]|uniref:Phospholipid/glycerol acyltransferase domain-containing protein n=3 Tax=Harpellales TaxID=61421 RepID=A0A2T9YIM0_9FUNG|nr:hypothetical protein BB559_003786 [Furculomyces boomerangus]PWA03088.1 hypothetical protein BB558_000747 [Smittium angustum]